MNLNRKTSRRLLIIGVVAVLAVLAALALVVVRQWRIDQRMAENRASGLAAFAQGDYPATLSHLAPYLRRSTEDREAWLAFAQAREKTEEPNGSHLQQAMRHYEKVLKLDENDRETAMKLLRLYNNVAFHNEARDLAMRLRPTDLGAASAEHAGAIEQEIVARIGLKKYDQVLDALTHRLTEIQPESYRAGTLRAAFLVERENKSESLEYVRELARRHEGDTRYQLFLALTEFRAAGGRDPSAVRAAACAAAGLGENRAERLSAPSYTEPEFVAQLVALFDSLGMPRHSIAVLRDATQRLGDNEAMRLYARRAYQGLATKQLVEDLATIDPASPKVHAEIVAFKILAAAEQRQDDVRKTTLDALAARQRDAFARIWSDVLVSMDKSKGALERLKALDAALRDHPREPVFMYFRGETLASLGRTEEARAEWRRLYESGLARGWPVPMLRVSETFLNENRLEEAVRAANDAEVVSGKTTAAAFSLLRAQGAMLAAGRSLGEPTGVLRRLESACDDLRRFVGEAEAAPLITELLPARVALLVQSGRRDEARQVTLDAISAKPPIAPDIARRLAVVSARGGLGVETECIEAAESAGGKSPASVLARAILLDTQGKKVEGRQLLEESIRTASAPKTPWELALAQYLETIGDPGALEAWRTIADGNAGDLNVQLAAIRAASTATDGGLVQRISARLVQLGASDPDKPSQEVRLAKARSILAGRFTAAQRDEAGAILRGLLVESPDLLVVRRLLVGALLAEDSSRGIKADLAGAVEQLRAAAAIASDRSPLILELAEVLVRQGRRTDAMGELQKLALDERTPVGSRLQAVDLLINQGGLEAAVAAMDAIVKQNSSAPAAELLFRQARLLARLRRDTEALGAYRALVSLALPSPEMAVDVGLALRLLGDPEAEKKALAQINRPDFPPFRSALAEARLAQEENRLDDAASHFERAVTEAPDQLEAWLRFARFAMQAKRFPLAAGVAGRGLKQFPEQPDLTIIVQQAGIAQSGPDAEYDITALADTFAKNPATARVADALREIDRARRDGQLSDPSRIVALAARYPEQPALQLVAARLLLDLRPSRAHEAARVLRPAVDRFAGDAEILKLASQVFAAVGDIPAALSAAEALRKIQRTPDADVTLAEMLMASNRVRQALDTVAALSLPSQIDDKDSLSLRHLNVRVRGLASQGDALAAFSTLQPHLTASARARRDIGLATASEVVADLPTAALWIDQIAAVSNPPSPEDQSAIAQAWAGLARRFPANKADLLGRAIVSMRSVVASQAEPAYVCQLADLQEAAGDHAGAIETLTTASRDRSESLPISLALASTLLRAGKHAESLAAARETVRVGPDSFSGWALLAEIQLGVADRAKPGDPAGLDAKADAGRAFEKAAVLVGPDVAQRFLLASLAERLGNIEQAIHIYRQLLPDARPGGAIDPAFIRNNLAYALLINGAKGEALREARALAGDAVAAAPLAAFLDTLGAIEAALGDSNAAAASLRRGIAQEPNNADILAALADLLAGGTEAEKAEAKGFADRARAVIRSGGPIAAERLSKLDQAEAKLQAR